MIISVLINLNWVRAEGKMTQYFINFYALIYPFIALIILFQADFKITLNVKNDVFI